MRKKGCLGCSFPVLIVIVVVVFGLVIIGLLAGPIGKSFNVQMPSWLTIHQPEIKLPAEAVFHILGFPVTNTILATWLTIAFLAIFAWAATRRMKLIPNRVQILWEAILGWLYSFCQSVAGENARKFFPIIATIFLFVITNAWLAFLPIFGSFIAHTHEGEFALLRAANTDINTPLALAIISFVSVEAYGFKAHGIGYLSKFFNFGPMVRSFGQIFRGKVKAGFGGLITGVINAFVGIIELLSEFIRILSLTIRLFGNMIAGEILLLIVAFLVPFVIIDVFYVLELLFGFVQAFIFSSLTLVFLTMAVASHEAEHDHEAEHIK
jgi:F-type H+-transporting ATPase subunit a